MTSRLIAALSTAVGIVAVCLFSGALVSGQVARDAACARRDRIRRQGCGVQGAAHALGRSGFAGRLVERRHGEHPDGRWRRVAAVRDAVPRRRPRLLRRRRRDRLHRSIWTRRR